MNSARDIAVEMIKCPFAELEFRFTGLVMEARVSKFAWDVICEVYHLAAARVWTPDPSELHMLVFAPLENPALAAHIEFDMDRILSGRSQFLLAWRYIQYFSGVLVLQPLEAISYLS